MITADYKSVGFIGLGAMGAPMVRHLAAKLPDGTPIFVFDVVQGIVDEICAQNPGRIFKSTNAKDVAEKSVCIVSDLMSCCSISWKRLTLIDLSFRRLL